MQMIRILLLDDDKSVIDLLTRIIKKTGVGAVCGSFTDPQEALHDIKEARPDVVLVDLLMPELDGVSFVRQASLVYPDAAYVMLSQVSDKHMLADAYNAGVKFFIQKPVNSVEVVNVIRNVYENLQLSRTMTQVSKLISPAVDAVSKDDAETQDSKTAEYSRRLRNILSTIGMLGQRGSDDIIQICEYYMYNEKDLKEKSLKDICAIFSDAPKSMEQRIRRTTALGLVNLANMGLEDYSNDVFNRYATSLFGFDQVRAEMNYIQGKSDVHGVVKIRLFLTALIYACKE